MNDPDLPQQPAEAIMNRLIITSLDHQYAASLDMLRNIVSLYADGPWYRNEPNLPPSWQIAYHATFFTNIYAAPSHATICTWGEERDGYENLADSSRKSPYRVEEMLEFIDCVGASIPIYLVDLDLEADCWPKWYSMNTLTFQLNNLRHLQHHTGQLVERLKACNPIQSPWLAFS
jgi:hypothetical protein